ncbi:purine phosphorylase [Glaciecola sp. SC05]|uniref:5'-methylthioadenosine/S-adenosylhomocysteine nucleosidase family protein n=1 Tax=Glaciecola sp. SC05 TaxID=1987355 RepID=UPI0035284745
MHRVPALFWRFALIFGVCLSLLFSTYQASAQDFGPRDFTGQKKWTAIVTAYEPEIKAIDSAFSAMPDASIDRVMNIKGIRYQLGTYKDKPIIIFTTGISVPNAAMTMQMALDYFPIDTVLMMGVAGAINPIFEPGDIAIPERWYFHDESVYVNPAPNPANNKSGPAQPILSENNQYVLPGDYIAALERYKARERIDPHAPKYQNFGWLFPDEVSIVKKGWDKPRKTPYFTASEPLLRHARNAVKNMPPIQMPSGKAIKVAIGGNGVTGSVFADNAQYRLWLEAVYSAQVTEMESAAVAMVCFVNEVDWLIIRSVSDLAGGQHGQNEEDVFDAIASGTGTKLLIGILDELVK